jgi:glycosyltransferase involved in cell wall biosynthesis
MADLTVIITTRNRCALLQRAIESVRDCKREVDLIVVDDASSDGTQSYCEVQQPLKYIRLATNQGTAAARNAGIREAATDYISFLDDDDWRLPASFDRQLEVLKSNSDCALVYGKVLFSNQANQLTGESNLSHAAPEGNVVAELFRRNFITLSSVVVRKECILGSGMFDISPQMLGLEDWDMWLRLSLSYSIMAVNEPVAVYRKPEWNSGQWYSDIGRQFSMAALAYRNKWYHLPGLQQKLGNEYPRLKKLVQDEISDIITFGALNNSKNMREKARGLASAVRCRPRNLISFRFYKAVGKALINAK